MSSSIEFLSEVANRLNGLLPAMSVAQAQDFTAQVYGYRNWQHFNFEVSGLFGSKKPGPLPYFTQGQSALTMELSWSEYESQVEDEINKVAKLLGASRRAAEHLYVTWSPHASGLTKDVQLAQLGKGTPAFELMQRNIFGDGDVSNVIAGFENGFVQLGFPGTSEQRKAAGVAFLASMWDFVSVSENRELAAQFTKELQVVPSIVPLSNEGAFAQVLPMTFFAGREHDEFEMLGLASVTFTLMASEKGEHCVNIAIERFVSKEYAEIRSAMSEVIAVAVWEAVTRYLWCTVNNMDKTALVSVRFRADHPEEAKCAQEVYNLIEEYCGWHFGEHPSETDVRFQLVPAD